MAARMRALDWSTTALGPVEQWPQALRTSVRIVLGSGYPMAICWGPDFALLYNDAYGRCWEQSTRGRSVAVPARCIPRHGISSGRCTKR